MLRLVFSRNICKLNGFSFVNQIENGVNRMWVSTSAIRIIGKSTPSPFTVHSFSPAVIQFAAYCTEPQKKKKQKKQPPAVDHVGRLDLRIGKIVEVNKAPDADTLYLTKVNIGGEVLSIVAGLTKHLTAEELLHSLVVVLCNLKPSKLRGHLSEGMIVCAKDGDHMELLVPPSGAAPGDKVHCENYDRVPVETPRDRKKLFDPLAADLQTNDQLIACYKGSYLYVPEKGNIVAKTLKNSSIS